MHIIYAIICCLELRNESDILQKTTTVYNENNIISTSSLTPWIYSHTPTT